MGASLLVPWDGTPPRHDPPLPRSSPASPSHWLDVDFARAFSESMVRPWADGWFRAVVHGAEHVPAARGAVLAMNHSGMGWPWDAVHLHAPARRHTATTPATACPAASRCRSSSTCPAWRR